MATIKTKGLKKRERLADGELSANATWPERRAHRAAQLSDDQIEDIVGSVVVSWERGDHG